MADRQHEVLAERVQHGERHLVVVVTAVDRVPARVAQGVVHPPHVPFHREAEPADVRRAGDTGPRGGLLGDRDDSRHALVDGGVHLLQELDGLQVLPATVRVGCPAADRPGVVQIEHRGHRVDPQPVQVEFAQPVQCVGHQEVAYLGTAEVENVSAPIQLFAAARIGVLVERGAVEAAQSPAVLGEVGRNPVHDHADAGPVQRVDEEPEIVWRAESGGWSVVGRHLVAPRPPERVLGHR